MRPITLQQVSRTVHCRWKNGDGCPHSETHTPPTASDTTATQAASHGGRLEFIDAIRGVAALIVAIGHGADRWWPAYQNWSIHHFDPGRIGIVAFFLVSGYVVGMTLTKQTPRTFVVRRFWRLYPVYWLATIAYVVTIAITHHTSIDYSLFVIALNITMLQGFIGGQSILGVAWTLGIEIAFYGQSTLAKFLNRLRWSAFLGWFWLAAFAAMAFSNKVRGSELSALMPLMIFTACAGYALFLWDTQRNRLVFAYAAAAVVLIPPLSWVLSSGHRVSPFTVWPASGFATSYLLGVAIFAAFYFMRGREQSRILLWLGSVSYALYLVHVTVIGLVHQTKVPGQVGLPIAIGLTLLVAWGTHIWIERPSINAGRQRTPSRREAKTAGS
jgi:peptidoglycan/LPS O-acetylase OafA/YrhL